jgi:hypothetical protein
MLALLKIIKALSVGLSDSDLLSSRGKPSISGRERTTAFVERFLRGQVSTYVTVYDQLVEVSHNVPDFLNEAIALSLSACSKLNKLRPGLMRAVFTRNQIRRLVRNAGVMTVVVKGGRVQPLDAITIQFPAKPYTPLSPI